eukprot:scaffold2186_cov245-Pinguiococcus_pyrenoidosus.AAC.3
MPSAIVCKRASSNQAALVRRASRRRNSPANDRAAHLLQRYPLGSVGLLSRQQIRSLASLVMRYRLCFTDERGFHAIAVLLRLRRTAIADSTPLRATSRQKSASLGSKRPFLDVCTPSRRSVRQDRPLCHNGQPARAGRTLLEAPPEPLRHPPQLHIHCAIRRHPSS